MNNKSNQKSLTDKMRIDDCEKTAEGITDFIYKKVKQKRKKGIVIGLSGGIDSSTVTFLAARALEDPSNVHVLHIPDEGSEKRFEKHAREVAQKLGVRFKKIMLTKEKKGGTLVRFIIKCMNTIPFLDRFLVWVFDKAIQPLFFKEQPLITDAKKSEPKEGFFAKKIYNISISIIERGFNVKHRARRKIVEEYAEYHNLLPIGCANRSEFFLGWFVRGGIDDLPIAPILGLYKNQVYQLASWLGIPKNVLKEAPSPDIMKSKMKDEDFIGYSYEKVDKVAYVVENNLNPQVAFDEGITSEEFRQIKKLHKFSDWKDMDSHEFPDIQP